MAVRCQQCPLRKLDCFVRMSADEVAFMDRFKVGELVVEPGTPILSEGANVPQLYTVLSGMGLRYKLLTNGRRQVLNFLFPGDFIGLQAGITREMTHSVESVSHMRLCVFDRSGIWTLFRSHPERAFSLTWLAAVEERFMGDALASIGQRTAEQRIAWSFARLFRRLDGLGLERAGRVPLPFRQQDLADAVGLSLVHTNKTIARLRERQLATWSNGSLLVHDLETLEDIALIDRTREERRPLI